MRLGEVLIEDGAISVEQLEKALDVQLMHGGHLGTCLLELGYVSEERLGQALARASGVPYAPPANFFDIPPFVVNALPAPIVQKQSAIPIQMTDGILDVAMIDPRSSQSIDEIRFASGCAIRSWIAPQVRIFQAMDHYYDVPMRIRYVTACRALDGNKPFAKGAFSGALDRRQERRAGAPGAGMEAPGTVSDLLAWAETEDEIAALVLGAVKGTLRRRILFKVHAGKALVWKADGVELDREVAATARFPILEESIFGLLRGDDYYAGPLPQDPMHHGFYRKLGIDRPAQVYLLPVHLDDRLVAVLYADERRNATMVLDVDAHRRLLEKAALAVNVVQARQKICAV